MADVRETEEKGRSMADVMNLVKTMFNEMNKGFNELRGVINKRFEESDVKWDQLIDSTKQRNNDYSTGGVVVVENGTITGECTRTKITKK